MIRSFPRSGKCDTKSISIGYLPSQHRAPEGSTTLSGNLIPSNEKDAGFLIVAFRSHSCIIFFDRDDMNGLEVYERVNECVSIVNALIAVSINRPPRKPGRFR